MIRHIFKLIWNKKGSNALLILEIFLSFLILFAVVSYVLFNTDRMALPVGFDTENKWVIHLDQSLDSDTINFPIIMENLERELNDMENIQSVAFSNGVSPYGGSTWLSVDDAGGFEIRTRYAMVDEHFGETMDVELTSGRWFSEDDEHASFEPMIVNQHFIDQYFPDKNMIDSFIQFNGEKKIVGIVSDYRYGGMFEELQNTAFLYIPKTNTYTSVAYLDMVPNTPVAYEEKINELVERVTNTTSFVIRDLETLRKRRNKRTWIPMIALLSISGFLCINIALGLFGVLWYNIQKRRPEIGLRKAMGAHSSDVARQFTLETIMLAGLALVLGIFFAIQVPLLKIIAIDQSILYRAIILSSFIILLIVFICSLYPSVQASRIHPATALHED